MEKEDMATERFHLVGPREGATIKLGGYVFTEGVCSMVGSVEEIAVATRFLRTFHSAYPHREWELMQMAKKTQELTKVEPPAPTTGEAPPAPAPTPTTGEAPPAPAPAPTTDLVKEPLEEDIDLATALAQLDPNRNDDWTSNNLPALDVLSERTGKKVARSDVEALAPGYTRAKAREARS
jgi:hypothetical protein